MLSYHQNMKTWQTNLRTALAARDITQAELAARLHVSEGTISHWISGRHRPSIDRLKEIARLVGMTFSELVEGDETFLRDEDELELIRSFRSIDPAQRDQARKLALAVLDTLKTTNED